MESDTPKPLLPLAGKSVLYWSIHSFLFIEELSQIIIPTQLALIEPIKAIIRQVLEESNRVDIKVDIILGGNERLYSIANALPIIDESIDLVMVHDAVRPLVSNKAINLCIDKTLEKGACILGLPLRETIKQINDDACVVSTPNRATLWSIQTPQCFSRSVFDSSYKKALESKYFGTDDASVVEFAGNSVFVSSGNSENIKITYPLDLKLAELLIKERNDK
jgi:2-C-methyl-D-erythritol 4-phosphate cytidylyltransferase